MTRPVEQRISHEELRRVVARLSSEGERAGLSDALDQVVRTATTFFAVSGAGIMFADDEHVLHYVAASDEDSARLEEAQRQESRGPCVDALVLGENVTTSNVTTDERWPGLHEKLASSRVRAVLGTPVHVAGAPVGSINLYRDTPYDWTEEDVRAFSSFAGIVDRLMAAALNAARHEELAEQLQHALDHRVVIERAVGILMERDGIDAPGAFEQLRGMARNSRRRVFEVASEIVERPAG
jgi:GAF domain-containing protein